MDNVKRGTMGHTLRCPGCKRILRISNYPASLRIRRRDDIGKRCVYCSDCGWKYTIIRDKVND